MTRKTEAERIKEAEARVAQLKHEAKLRADALADRKARGPSASALNQLGRDYRLIRRAIEIIDARDPDGKLAGQLTAFASTLHDEWQAGVEKKQTYAEKHEAGAVDLEKVKPLEGGE
jgi:hypothetical protein